MESYAFLLPKRGNRLDEWEDAYATDNALGRFAVADGATESAYAKSWAQLLVDRFVESADSEPDQWEDWFPGAQQDWAAQFVGRELPYYAQAKCDEGAFATFLGVVLREAEGLVFQWHAVAVGDSCLFHTRGSDLLRAYPLRRSDMFRNSPVLVGSRVSPTKVTKLQSPPVFGIGQPKDRLWLMTDALAHWVLSQHEMGNCPWPELEQLLASSGSDGVFSAWIERLRDHQKLRNDDVTLLAIVMG